MNNIFAANGRAVKHAVLALNDALILAEMLVFLENIVANQRLYLSLGRLRSTAMLQATYV